MDFLVLNKIKQYKNIAILLLFGILVFVIFTQNNNIKSLQNDLSISTINNKAMYTENSSLK
jgi:hypothetical protein